MRLCLGPSATILLRIMPEILHGCVIRSKNAGNILSSHQWAGVRLQNKSTRSEPHSEGPGMG